jgi:uncharacterized protein
MRCPRCEDAELTERDRQEVKVDICQSCRGVWLDRGELEKLMASAERAAAEEQAYWSGRPAAERAAGPVEREPSGVYREPRSDHDRDRDRHDDRSHPVHGQHRGYPRKKKHWLDTLGDIFD